MGEKMHLFLFVYGCEISMLPCYHATELQYRRTANTVMLSLPLCCYTAIPLFRHDFMLAMIAMLAVHCHDAAILPFKPVPYLFLIS